MRGGLDDALDKLARRDELRRRAAGEATGTPPAVTELVEAVAGVVGRHPELGVSVGVEGSGEPLLLHFYVADGQVQVTAENAAALQPAAPGAPRAADIDVEVGEPVDRPWSAAPTPPSAPPASYDDQERFGYSPPQQPYYDESDTAERQYGDFDQPPVPDPRFPAHDVGESSRDLGARLRDLGMASSSRSDSPVSPAPPEPQYPPHPFAATPPPRVPEQAQETTRRINPTPLPKPVPLQVERPEETEMAARRLAAMLRDDPTLLEQ
ncbi:hypothetical protein Ade02nite_39300 [Paractinoplanes deccanensis]|uniref:Uncharacterized protein n=1 Tax=Paractinoplanes deccanensis TaxID=113561 RepID=A0ABQ3Y5M5_9ACTN|nr:hypothetical protein [Actinoplanes deccanensis]GID75289.1 hypothetical protein Ade02nite_39300 [Actinoplanes deccanensis]